MKKIVALLFGLLVLTTSAYAAILIESSNGDLVSGPTTMAGACAQTQPIHITSALSAVQSNISSAGGATCGAPVIIHPGGSLGNTTTFLPSPYSLTNNYSFLSGSPMYVGALYGWLEGYRLHSESIAAGVFKSAGGNYGLIGASRTSDNSQSGAMSAIGLGGYGINDNTAQPKPAWGAYLEGRRLSGAGPVFDIEADMVNYDATPFSLDPYSGFSASTAQSVNLWISQGGGYSSPQLGYTASAGMVFLPNPATWQRGIVFRTGSLDGTTNEAIALPVGYQLAWYNGSTSKNSLMDHRQLKMQAQLTSPNLGTYFESKRQQNGGTVTQANNIVHQHFFYGRNTDNTTDYLGATQYVKQITDFSGGYARFGNSFTATNTDGTVALISLNELADRSFSPYVASGGISLGDSAHLWSTVYATTGTINTSDERYKKDISDIDPAVLRAWSKVRFVQYRFKDNPDKIHIGVIAQRIVEAFKSEGLNALDYGLVNYENDIYGVRYDECLALETALLRQRLEKLEGGRP